MGIELGQRLRLEHELDLGLMQEIKLTTKNVTDKARARNKARIRFSARSRLFLGLLFIGRP